MRGLYWRRLRGCCWPLTAPTELKTINPGVALSYDLSRKWLAFGATWRASPSLEYSVGYTHLFLDKPSVDLRSPTASTLRGNYSLTSDMLAVALAYRF